MGQPEIADDAELPEIEVTPEEEFTAGVQLAGDLPDGSDPRPGTPRDSLPQVPENRPKRRAVRMRYVRAVASWLGRITGLGLPVDIYLGAMNSRQWLDDYHAVIKTYQDPPRTLKELQADVGLGRPGYDDHHIVEKTLAERFGFARADINDPSNLVSIPRMKHWDINAWYMKENPDFGGLSPRKYLSDKSWAERRWVGLRALIDVGFSNHAPQQLAKNERRRSRRSVRCNRCRPGRRLSGRRYNQIQPAVQEDAGGR
ncbi:hypothetical protein [Rhodopseudomonas sp. BAL398]|uniref:hypothetical protein n=1 Tax=Rhodopseudomonas sp. BAL398 TaxID=3034676 RepID=UPI000B0760F9|nr:hypothetical protein [Rhodopseudomonas sp. BAL398]MDF3811090.1 hypothetical protein [Rhodopseudomonas sp. BAL398]WOK20880.1 hypothetical protein RBJ75_10860 [Rhodopseudomonas sp. BAL398]